MKRTSLICTIGLVCAVSLALQCTKASTQLANNGGSEVVGKLVNPANAPVNNALVYAYKISTDTSPTTLSPVDSTLSSVAGVYTFDSLDTGSYNLYSKAKFNGDSLYAYHAKVFNNVIAPKGQPPHRVDVGTDTMHAPGKISGRAILQPGDSTPITCYIPGSSFHAITDDTGAFTISFVPAGVYRVYYVDFSGIYQKAIDSGVTVVSDQTKKLADKVLLLSPIGAPPAPKALKLQYDLLSGQVTATWNSVNVSDLKNYIILRQIAAASAFDTVGRVSKSQTSFIDAVYTAASDTIGHLCTYKIFSEDSTGLISVTPVIDTISVISPSQVRTLVSIHVRPSGNSSGDTVAVNALVMVNAEFTNQSVQVQKIIWSVGKPDSMVDTSLFNTNTGEDSLQVAFKQSGHATIYLKAVDAAGRTRIDSLPLSVIQDAPVIRYCSPDTVIEFGGAFQCSVAVAHRFGLCSLLVDFNHDGKFEFRRKGAGLDTIVNTNTATSWGTIGIRVKDSHGNSIDTGFKVQIGAAPIHDRWDTCAPLSLPRRDLSVCTINNVVYAIGGRKRQLSAQQVWGFKAVNIVEKFDTTWTLQDTMKTARYDFASGVYGNAAYVFGGIGPKGQTKTIERFDPLLNKWTVVGTMPFGRAGAASCVAGNKFYLFGGRAADQNNQDSICNSIYSYDFTSAQWTLVGTMNSPRCNFQAVVSGGQIFLIGGFGGTEDPNAGNALPDVSLFDTITNQCRDGVAMPSGRTNFAAISVRDSIYVIGGISDDGTLLNENILYSPALGGWVTETMCPDNRSGLSAGIVNGKIIVVGGGTSLLTMDPGYADPAVKKYYP